MGIAKQDLQTSWGWAVGFDGTGAGGVCLKSFDATTSATDVIHITSIHLSCSSGGGMIVAGDLTICSVAAGDAGASGSLDIDLHRQPLCISSGAVAGDPTGIDVTAGNGWIGGMITGQW